MYIQLFLKSFLQFLESPIHENYMILILHVDNVYYMYILADSLVCNSCFCILLLRVINKVRTDIIINYNMGI